MEKSKKTFESALHELEKIVQDLENGEMTLDESIDGFQKGVELSKFCAKKLDEAEKKISILIEDDDGNVVKKDFACGEDEDK